MIFGEGSGYGVPAFIYFPEKSGCIEVVMVDKDEIDNIIKIR